MDQAGYHCRPRHQVEIFHAAKDCYIMARSSAGGGRGTGRVSGQDRLVSRRGGVGSEEAINLDEIDIPNDCDWVDTRAKDSLKSYQKYVKERHGDDASKHPLFDPDSWVQAVGGKKKGRLYGFNDISDPHAVMTGIPSMPGTSTSYLPATNEEVQRLNEKIAQLQQEKETERLEKEKERSEKLTMMEQIEQNRIANADMKEENTEMKEQIRFLLKNIPKSSSN
ncbi:uncharacterized protein LOC143621697 [Bidens hawaiensis]|uniref:uncharacterized protein LOC143621694 n=1 Tax=Bidens hawaiensis TaxID=980011 RepID=UPI00404AFAF3